MVSLFRKALPQQTLMHLPNTANHGTKLDVNVKGLSVSV